MTANVKDSVKPMKFLVRKAFPKAALSVHDYGYIVSASKY